MTIFQKGNYMTDNTLTKVSFALFAVFLVIGTLATLANIGGVVVR